MIKNFEELIEHSKVNSKMKLVIAAAQDVEVLLAVEAARKNGIIDGILVGNSLEIKKLGDLNNIDLSNYEIIDVYDKNETAKVAVEIVSSGQADFLMKGLIGTADILRAVLDKEIGIRTNNLLSHVMIYSIPKYKKFIFLTDGGMVINPDLNQKIQIINNAVKVAKALDVSPIHVAPLSAVEVVNNDMQSTVDAAILSKMNQRGQIKDCIIDGPLSFDIAISKEAAEHKGVISEVAGNADILLVPNIEAGNLLGKSFTYFANAKSAGVIMGAKCPVVLVSRADDHEAKLNSIALGSIVASLK